MHILILFLHFLSLGLFKCSPIENDIGNSKVIVEDDLRPDFTRSETFIDYSLYDSSIPENQSHNDEIRSMDIAMSSEDEIRAARSSSEADDLSVTYTNTFNDEPNSNSIVISNSNDNRGTVSLIRYDDFKTAIFKIVLNVLFHFLYMTLVVLLFNFDTNENYASRLASMNPLRSVFEGENDERTQSQNRDQDRSEADSSSESNSSNDNKI